MWLHNGKEIHDENVEDTFLQVTTSPNENNSSSGIKDNEAATNRLTRGLSRSFSLSSTILPLMISNRSTDIMTLNGEESQNLQNRNEYRNFVDHGKVHYTTAFNNVIIIRWINISSDSYPN